MCRLRSFEIDLINNFDLVSSFLMSSLCISLTSPATLEHLKFHFKFRGRERESYLDEFYESLRQAEVWNHLDSIITIPTGSRLQRVDINIDYFFHCDNSDAEFDEYEKDSDEDDYGPPDEGEILEAVLDNLPLLRTKGILFVDVFEGAWSGLDSRTILKPQSGIGRDDLNGMGFQV